MKDDLETQCMNELFGKPEKTQWQPVAKPNKKEQLEWIKQQKGLEK